jgi:LuxR family transcriptional regulator, maltose regulon positive regulatory protein
MGVKLRVPQLPHGMVPRQRLLDELESGAASRATLVSAGPGWGKTMLVARWAALHSTREPVAWVSLDSDDNDPVLFWSYVLAAVRGAVGELSPALRGLVISPPLGRELLRRIVVGLAEIETPLTLVLDDLGEIHSPEILEGLGHLLRYPSSIRLVLITRSDPALHLHRLRLGGELSEVRAADLAFTAVEAGELMTAAGVRMPAEQQARLLQRTEGWAAGLRLAALAAHRWVDTGDLATSDAYEGTVTEYLFEEVLAGLSDERRRFLHRTCVADKLCGDLADILSGTTGGQEELEELEHANVFVVSLGPGHQWFRYHALMADLLRQRLLLEDPKVSADLYERAARWFAAQGDPLSAVRHAVRGQRWQLVGELIVSGAASRAIVGERKAFGNLLEQIPASELSTSAELRVCGALTRLLNRDPAGFAAHVAEARAMLKGRDPESARAVEIFLGAAQMVLARYAGDMPALQSAAEQILEWLSDPADTLPATARQYEAPALSNRGVALVWSGREDEAEPDLRLALDVASATGSELTVLNSLGHLGLLDLDRGRLEAAAASARQALELAEQRGSTELGQCIAVYLVLAEVHLERDELEATQSMLERGLAAQQNDPEWTPYPALQALRARLLLTAGQVGPARDLIRAVRAERANWVAPARLRDRLASVEAEIQIAQGRPDAALDGLRSHVRDGVRAPEILSLWSARAELAIGDFSGAAGRVAKICDSPGSAVVATKAWLVAALAADHVRDDHQALIAMRRALAIAEPDDIKRPFLSLDDARVGAILGHLAHLGDDTSFADAVLSRLNSSSKTSATPAPLAQALTDREMVVLSHIAQLETNEEIAEALYVSVNTVKAHARSVYRKLAVSNRREAVNRARDLGLI